MKLICLNTGGGFVKKALHEFIAKHATDTDIFCFQEVFENADVNSLGDIDQNLYTTISDLLPSYIGYYAPAQDNDEGIAMFVKVSLKLHDVGNVFVHRSHNAMEDDNRKTLGRNIQFIHFTQNNEDYTIINFHGLWNGAGKTDSPDRLTQSKNIRDFIDTKAQGKVILVGDFNLEPSTQSLSILEQGMRNLIKENGITSTRSLLYKWENRFADYAIVSKDVKLARFEILQDQVSDHLPMLLEFS